MIGARYARWSAALALIAGLLGMHGLVVVDVGHPGGPAPVGSATAAAHPAAPAAVVNDPAALSGGSPAASHGGASTTGHDSSPHGAHQMLHLCLAVLVALLVLVGVVGLVWSLGRGDAAALRVAPGTGRRAPPRRPPPTSVRLAQLCVMRN